MIVIACFFCLSFLIVFMFACMLYSSMMSSMASMTGGDELSESMRGLDVSNRRASN